MTPADLQLVVDALLALGSGVVVLVVIVDLIGSLL